jgi:SRSO17 transposase
VTRQYSDTLGRVDNCQVAVSVHADTDSASAPLDWRLFLAETRDDNKAKGADSAAAITSRRMRAGIPDDEHHRPKWEMALEMIDELISWVRTPVPVVADAGYGEATAFRLELTERHIPYVVAVKATTTAHPGEAVPTHLDRHLPTLPPPLPHLTKS